MEFCHSFGRGASLATLDTPGENRKIKTWLLEHGEQSFYLQHFEVLVFLGDDTLENLVQNDILYQQKSWRLAITVSSGKDPRLSQVSASYARLRPILETRPCDRLQVQQHRFVSFDMLD